MWRSDWKGGVMDYLLYEDRSGRATTPMAKVVVVAPQDGSVSVVFDHGGGANVDRARITSSLDIVNQWLAGTLDEDGLTWILPNGKRE